ncbi:hypothetical protein D9757_010383 [Collybiopsis confluens]|uniref:Uncharacterized protein n=1 Tax=Collybiopsis confluens TaxID=2823264 RepID=A0A8H5LW40_9AGAR|nr:hypothetical protein D9757_010383 [Collybiopsis confluens]
MPWIREKRFRVLVTKCNQIILSLSLSLSLCYRLDVCYSSFSGHLKSCSLYRYSSHRHGGTAELSHITVHALFGLYGSWIIDDGPPQLISTGSKYHSSLRSHAQISHLMSLITKISPPAVACTTISHSSLPAISLSFFLSSLFSPSTPSSLLSQSFFASFIQPSSIMLSRITLFCLGALLALAIRPVWSFSFSVNPSPVGLNQDYEVSWIYTEGDAPDDSFAIEVQGEGGYLQWLGFFNSSGSTFPPAIANAGVYTLAAYTNVPGLNTGTFFTSMFTVQNQPNSPTNPPSSIQVSAQVSTTTSSPPVSPKVTPASEATSSSETTTSSTAAPSTIITHSSVTTSESTFSSNAPRPISTSSATVRTGTSTSPLTEATSSLITRPSPSLTSPSSPSATTSSSSSDAKSKNIIIGISVGISLFLIVLSLGGLYFWLRKRGQMRDIERDEIAPRPFYRQLESSDSQIQSAPDSLRLFHPLPPSKALEALRDRRNTSLVPLNKNIREMRNLYEIAEEPIAAPRVMEISASWAWHFSRSLLLDVASLALQTQPLIFYSDVHRHINP